MLGEQAEGLLRMREGMAELERRTSPFFPELLHAKLKYVEMCAQAHETEEVVRVGEPLLK